MSDSDDEIEVRKKRAERGWITESPPTPPRMLRPGEEKKWYLMMGATNLLQKFDRPQASDNSAAQPDS